jgi:thiamine-phosphate pyrophosphorylase
MGAEADRTPPRLYLITDRRATAGRPLVEVVRAALAGLPPPARGAAAVSLREKDLDGRALLELARALRAVTGDAGARLFVNDRVDVALAAGADGVHLPADGLPVAQVRAHTPRGFRVGVSTHSPEEAAAAAEEADVVLLGPIFDTPSKRRFGPPLGPDALARLPPRSSQRAPIFAIGGIDEAALDRLEAYRERIAGVAGIRLFQDASDPRAVVERIAARGSA